MVKTNDQKRTRLRASVALLNKAQNIVESVKYEEQDSLENFPENLQNSEKFAIIENNIDMLEEAEDDIRRISESISEIL